MVATTVAIPFPNLILSNENIEAEKKYPINFFTKPLDKYGNDFMIDTLKMGGVDGLDLTVTKFYTAESCAIFCGCRDGEKTDYSSKW